MHSVNGAFYSSRSLRATFHFTIFMRGQCEMGNFKAIITVTETAGRL